MFVGEDNVTQSGINGGTSRTQEGGNEEGRGKGHHGVKKVVVVVFALIWIDFWVFVR